MKNRNDHRTAAPNVINLFGKAILLMAQFDEVSWDLDEMDVVINGVRLNAVDRYIIATDLATGKQMLIDRRYRSSIDVEEEDRRT